MNFTWEHYDNVLDVNNNGPNYLLSLIYDYEKYMRDFGFITMREFIKGCKCITRKTFERLQVGDFVYTPDGRRFVVAEEPWEADDEISLFVEVAKTDDISINTFKNTITMQSGDLYSEDVIHEHYRWKKKINRESEESLCPILITKTNQPQS